MIVFGRRDCPACDGCVFQVFSANSGAFRNPPGSAGLSSQLVGRDFFGGRNVFKWMGRRIGEMKSGRIFARILASCSNFRERARAPGSLKGEMALRGAEARYCAHSLLSAGGYSTHQVVFGSNPAGVSVG